MGSALHSQPRLAPTKVNHARRAGLVSVVAATIIAGAGVAFTAHAALSDDPAPRHATTSVTPAVDAPGYDPRIDGINPILREAALRLQRLREARAQDLACQGGRGTARAC